MFILTVCSTLKDASSLNEIIVNLKRMWQWTCMPVPIHMRCPLVLKQIALQPWCIRSPLSRFLPFWCQQTQRNLLTGCALQTLHITISVTSSVPTNIKTKPMSLCKDLSLTCINMICGIKTRLEAKQLTSVLWKRTYVLWNRRHLMSCC